MTLPGPDEWPTSEPLPDPSSGLLAERRASTPETTALLAADTGRSVTYATLERRAAGLGEALESRASGPIDRVGTLLDTSVAFADVLFATDRAGWSLVALNPGHDRERLGRQVDAADVDLLVCQPAVRSDARAASPEGTAVVTTDEVGAGDLDSDPRPSGSAPAVVSRSDERLVLFTSGTTGDPKGVRITHGNLLANAVGSAFRLGVEPGDRWLVCLPTYHMGGLSPFVRSTLYGTTVVVQPRFDARATARVIAGREVTCVSLVPTMLGRLLDAGWDPPAHLRVVLLGGGPIDPTLVERCRDRGVPVHPSYGTTETASQVATARPETAFGDPDTVGRPLRGVDVRIVDEEGSVLPRGAEGQLVVDGPTVSPGYLDGASSEGRFGSHGFETGDLGRLDQAGRLHVAGRMDERILTGGETVAPDRVASALRDLDGVGDAVVVGLPDEEWGERVGAVVAADGREVTPASLRSACRQRLAEHEVPKSLRIVDELPRTASGTVDRTRARDLLLEQ